MQILVTGKQMKQLDQSTIKQMGIPSLVLMERAAMAVFDCLKQHFPLKKTLVVCGSGNNGADGVAVARLLHLAGYPVDLYLAGNHTSFTEEMHIQWQAAKNYQVSIVNNCRFSEYTTIVDALFGVGLSRELSGKYQALAEKITYNNELKEAVSKLSPRTLNCVIQYVYVTPLQFLIGPANLDYELEYGGKTHKVQFRFYWNEFSFGQYVSSAKHPMEMQIWAAALYVDGNQTSYGITPSSPVQFLFYNEK